MLGIVELIFSIVGIYGFFAENLNFLIVGLVAIIICDFIDIFVCGHNPTTILLACMLAIGASIANKNPLSSFTIALCGENFIMTIITVLMIAISFIISKLKKEEYNIDEEEKVKTPILNNIKYWKIISLALIMLVITIGFVLVRIVTGLNEEINNLYSIISNLEEEKDKALKEYADANWKYAMVKNKVDFMDEYVVIVPYSTKIYHKYDCKYCGKTNGGTIYHKEEARDRGYKPCKYCII